MVQTSKHWVGHGIPIDWRNRSLPRPARYLLGDSLLAGQEHHHHPIPPRQYRPLLLPPEYDQLLAQEGVLLHQFRLGPDQIRYSLWCQRVIVRLGPLTNMTFHCLVKRICASLHEGIEWEGHSLPFWLVVEGYDSTALDTEIERMYIFGQHRWMIVTGNILPHSTGWKPGIWGRQASFGLREIQHLGRR